jgi:hypothetical protein
VAKVVRKLNREKALAADTQKASERITITKECCRLMVEVLWRIIGYKDEYFEQYRLFPHEADANSYSQRSSISASRHTTTCAKVSQHSCRA